MVSVCFFCSMGIHSWCRGICICNRYGTCRKSVRKDLLRPIVKVVLTSVAMALFFAGIILITQYLLYSCISIMVSGFLWIWVIPSTETKTYNEDY